MSYTKEFNAGYICEKPEYLPAALAERLEFLSLLSEKSSRSVWLTRDRTSGEKAVLKIAECDSADSISREYALLKKLDYPAIPRAILYDSDDNGREYLLRSYAEGDTLDALVDRDGVFDERQVLEIAQKLCEIFSYLHSQKPPIIYRDVKPQNIVMTPNGRLSLIDFGISREDKSDKEYDTIYVGSVAFASPEQFGFAGTDSRSDVFSLGKLMLYLATGQTHLPDFRQKIASKKLAGLIARCTALAPDKRYASIDRLSRAIGRILKPPTLKEILLGCAAALLVVCVGLFGLWQLYGPGEDAPATAPVSAGGGGYEDEVKIPVSIEVLMDGRPFADCAVAVDNHHWYQPAANGKAELAAFAHDEYRIRAVYRNQTAYVLAPVMRDTEAISFTFDLAQVPTAPEILPLTLAFGQNHEIPLPVTLADGMTLDRQPEGVSVAQRDGQFYLSIADTVAEPGHYTIFAEAVNEHGKADLTLSLHLTEDKPVTVIRTAREFSDMRNDLAGHYELGADIDLGEFESWTPIGDTDHPFTGVLDGKGYAIIGLRIDAYGSEATPNAGLFSVIDKAVIRNLIVWDAELSVVHAGRGETAVFAGENRGGLIEHCAAMGGSISADVGLESSAAGICGLNSGIVRGCFNSADIIIYTAGSKDFTESFAGGVCGVNTGTIADCGNTGAVTGICLAGGIAAFNDTGVITRCYSAGAIKAPAYPLAYLPGGISQLLGRGKIISYCAFEEGTAQVGAGVYNGGTLLGIVPLSKEEFGDLDALGKVFHLDNAKDRWEYIDAVPGYPVPKGIFE
ncbi:protein kinase [Oscillospiraceae bacterium OttesenSCG-928-G22]|nr:protein kinase [Oscillospiraceae bacterium OttesenSCG-928-G22]